MKKISENSFRTLVIVFYFALAFINLRYFFFIGRFWAEEGAVFYPALLERGFKGVFSFIFHGHLELLTNLVVYLSTLVELRYAPRVTTYLSFALQSLPFFILIFNRKVLGLTRTSVVLFVALILGSPGAVEVAANSINLHFHFALLTIIILILPATKLRNFLLLLAGLSGIPANALTPFFFYEAYREKSKERLVQFFILSFTSTIQIILIWKNQDGMVGREFAFIPLQVMQVFISQEIIQPLATQSVANELLTLLRSVTDGSLGGWAFFVMMSFVFMCVVYKALREGGRERLLILINLFLGSFCYFTSLKESLELFVFLGGCRYFYPVYPTLILILLYWLDRYRYGLLKIIFALLFVVSLNHIYIHASNGPGWGRAFRRGKVTQTYDIWPAGWHLEFTKK